MSPSSTRHMHKPVREVSDASQSGPATNIIYGLALGYKSSVIPIALAVTIYVSWTIAGMYGIAVAALGMISTIAIGLTIDAYGPVADNAGGIAEMSELGPEIRQRTDLLDAAGNTTAAIGKGFAIGSAVLTALALCSFPCSSSHEPGSSFSASFRRITRRWRSAFLTAQTMKGVGIAAYAMIEEVRRQFREKPGILTGKDKPDFRTCRYFYFCGNSTNDRSWPFSNANSVTSRLFVRTALAALSRRSGLRFGHGTFRF